MRHRQEKRSSINIFSFSASHWELVWVRNTWITCREVLFSRRVFPLNWPVKPVRLQASFIQAGGELHFIHPVIWCHLIHEKRLNSWVFLFCLLWQQHNHKCTSKTSEDKNNLETTYSSSNLHQRSLADTSQSSQPSRKRQTEWHQHPSWVSEKSAHLSAKAAAVCSTCEKWCENVFFSVSVWVQSVSGKFTVSFSRWVNDGRKRKPSRSPAASAKTVKTEKDISGKRKWPF